MQRAGFETAIRGQGFDEIIGKNGAPGFEARPRTHPFDVRILVLEGQMTVVSEGQPCACNPGEAFEMDACCEHQEKLGPAGSFYLLARRQGAQ